MLANNRHPRFSYLRRLVVLPLLAVVVVLFAFRSKEERARGPISVATMMEKVVAQSKNLLTVTETKTADTIVIQADTVYIQGKDKNDVVKIIPVLAKSKPLSKALIILDGKKVNNSVLDTLNTNLIATVDVLKGESATSTMYGEEGRNGIVLITTKKTITPKPLMILDGKKVDSSLLDLIDPSRIQSVNVLKNESATALYGDDGKNGVVMITTKKTGTPSEGPVTVTGYGAKSVTGISLAPSARSQNGSAGQFGAKTGVVRKYPDTLVWSSGANNYQIPSNVWVLIDGEPGNLNDVIPADIAEVRVIKDATAIARYGEAAKNGVVEVITKKAAEAMKAVEVPVFRNKLVGVKLFTEAETLPAFPGGPSAWAKYLERNMRRDLPAQNGAPPGKYTVTVSFVVSADGGVSHVAAQNNPGYKTVEEAIRLINNGPRWKPALQNGQPVNYQHKQVFTWVVKEVQHRIADLRSNKK